MNERQIRKKIGQKCNWKLTPKQWIKKFCGEQLAQGCFRDVYPLKMDPDRWIVKVERDMTFHNVLEYHCYSEARASRKPLEKMLAKVMLITMDGMFLIMRRVRIGERDEYPKTLPDIFCDFKVGNYGFIGKKFVCCDYSFILLKSLEKGVNLKRRIPVRWRKETNLIVYE